jgi:hypothetical protein
MFRFTDMLMLVLSQVAGGVTMLPKIFFDIRKPTALIPCGTVAHTMIVEVIETATHSADEIC